MQRVQGMISYAVRLCSFKAQQLVTEVQFTYIKLHYYSTRCWNNQDFILVQMNHISKLLNLLKNSKTPAHVAHVLKMSMFMVLGHMCDDMSL